VYGQNSPICVPLSLTVYTATPRSTPGLPGSWERRDILKVVEARYDVSATVFASQCPVKDWYPTIGDPTLADAICDRLLHNACRLELRNDSMSRKDGGAVKTENLSSQKRDGQTIESTGGIGESHDQAQRRFAPISRPLCSGRGATLARARGLVSPEYAL